MKLKAYLDKLLGEEKASDLLEACKTGRTIVVNGVQGSTGKTTLCKVLNKAGYRAIEAYTRTVLNQDSYTVNLSCTIESPIPRFEDTISV